MRVRSNIPNVMPRQAAPAEDDVDVLAIIGAFGVVVGVGMTLLAFAVNVLLADGPLISQTVTAPTVLLYLAGLLFLASLPVAYWCKRYSWVWAERYYASWNRQDAWLVFPALTAVLFVGSMMWFDKGTDFRADLRPNNQAAVRLLAGAAVAPALASGQERFFAQHGRYAASGTELRASMTATDVGALPVLRSLVVLNNGRTWLAHLSDGQQLARTHGQPLESAPAGATQLRRTRQRESARTLGTVQKSTPAKSTSHGVGGS